MQRLLWLKLQVLEELSYLHISTGDFLTARLCIGEMEGHVRTYEAHLPTDAGYALHVVLGNFAMVSLQPVYARRHFAVARKVCCFLSL